MGKCIGQLSKAKTQNRMRTRQSLGKINEFTHLITAVNVPSKEYTPDRAETRTAAP